jgi:hypothetical protein
MAEEFQIKLSTLEELVMTAKQIHEQHQKSGINSIPVLRIVKTANRQHPSLEDNIELQLLLEVITPIEVMEG